MSAHEISLLAVCGVLVHAVSASGILKKVAVSESRRQPCVEYGQVREAVAYTICEFRFHETCHLVMKFQVYLLFLRSKAKCCVKNIINLPEICVSVKMTECEEDVFIWYKLRCEIE